jgi:hypothetical protein
MRPVVLQKNGEEVAAKRGLTGKSIVRKSVNIHIRTAQLGSLKTQSFVDLLRLRCMCRKSHMCGFSVLWVCICIC